MISCGPAWHDPDGASYVIYILVTGFVIPNFIIIYTSIGVIKYQKMVRIHTINQKDKCISFSDHFHYIKHKYFYYFRHLNHLVEQ